MYKTLILILVFASCSLGASTKKSKNIVRPCPALDAKCVGDNLSANSKCSNRGLGLVPKSYTVPEFRFETPFFNASYVDHNLVVQNQHKCYISEFFFNLATDVAVLTVDCPNLILTSDRTVIQHYSGKENKLYSFNCTYKYPMIRMTVNFPRAEHINICNAFVYTEVVQLPTFVLTPNDKPTKDFLSYDLSYMYIYERETFAYRGPCFLQKYISTSVCNFNCFGYNKKY